MLVDTSIQKPTASIATLQKRLQEWAKQPSKLHRRYNWYNGVQLKTRIREIDTRVKTSGSKKIVLDLLVECETKWKQQNDDIASGEVRIGRIIVLIDIFVIDDLPIEVRS